MCYFHRVALLNCRRSIPFVLEKHWQVLGHVTGRVYNSLYSALNLTSFCKEPKIVTMRMMDGPKIGYLNPQNHRNGCVCGGMFARRAPSACPARYLCIKYPISSPKLILTLGSPPSRPH